MGAIASRITSLTIVYSTVYSDADQRKHQSSVSLVFVWGIHRGPVNSPHKGPVTRKMFPFDDVIMIPLMNEGKMVFIMCPVEVTSLVCLGVYAEYIMYFCVKRHHIIITSGPPNSHCCFMLLFCLFCFVLFLWEPISHAHICTPPIGHNLPIFLNEM